MKRRRSLAFRLLVVSLAAATLPALVVSGLQRSISSHALKTSIQQEQTELARRVAEKVDGEVRYAQGLLSLAAQSPVWSEGSWTDQERVLAQLLRAVPAFQETMSVADSGEERLKVNGRGVDLHLIRRTQEIHSPSIGAPFFAGNRLPTILMSVPIPPGSTRSGSGALMAKMSFNSLGRLMQETRIGPRGIAFVVDPGGMVLAHPDIKQVQSHSRFSSLPVVQAWMDAPLNPTVLQSYSDENGIPVVALAYPIPLLKSAVVVQQPQADVFAPLVRMRNDFILWTLVSVFVFIGLTAAVAWRILQPLRQLQVAADEIAHGRMDVRLDIHTHDELEELGRAFSRMAQSLRQLEAMRRDLINMIVHDLKAPLSSILASLDYLLTGELGVLNSDQRKFLSLGYRSGHDLFTLIQNLLDVAKMEEGKLILHKDSFAPMRWAENVIATFRPLAAAGKKELRLEAAENLPAVEGDEALLSRVLANLLSNAFHHTVIGVGEVVVALSTQMTQLAVSVRDNGPGIPLEEQDRIFEKFVQGQAQSTPVRSGTGLGLSFCKMVVEAHGGRIRVQSAPRVGSTFTFYLPLNVEPHILPPADEVSRALLSGSPN